MDKYSTEPKDIYMKNFRNRIFVHNNVLQLDKHRLSV